MTQPNTVYGVVLEPGERVIYYRRDDPGWQKPFLIVLGLLTLVAIIGAVFLLIGLTTSTTVYVVTTRRFLVIEGEKVSSIRHGAVQSVTRKVSASGAILHWLYLGDGQTRLGWQAQVHPPTMPALIEGWVRDPRSVEAAPTVPFERSRGPRSKDAAGA